MCGKYGYIFIKNYNEVKFQKKKHGQLIKICLNIIVFYQILLKQSVFSAIIDKYISPKMKRAFIPNEF